jgi:hypothetical protein
MNFAMNTNINRDQQAQLHQASTTLLRSIATTTLSQRQALNLVDVTGHAAACLASMSAANASVDIVDSFVKTMAAVSRLSVENHVPGQVPLTTRSTDGSVTVGAGRIGTADETFPSAAASASPLSLVKFASTPTSTVRGRDVVVVHTPPGMLPYTSDNSTTTIKSNVVSVLLYDHDTGSAVHSGLNVSFASLQVAAASGMSAEQRMTTETLGVGVCVKVCVSMCEIVCEYV